MREKTPQGDNTTTPTPSELPRDAKGRDSPTQGGIVPPPREGIHPPQIDSDPLLRRLAQSKAREGGVQPQVVDLLWGDEGIHPPPPSTKGWGYGDCDAQIQAINGSEASHPMTGIAAGFVHPLLQSMSTTKPKLNNKHQGGWKIFEREWAEFLTFVQA